MMPNAAQKPTWMDAAALCQELSISVNTLDNWMKKERFPQARLRGGKRFWRWSEVDQWMEGTSDKVEEVSPTERMRRAIQRQKVFNDYAR